MAVGTPLAPTSSTTWCEPSIRKQLCTVMALSEKPCWNVTPVELAMSLCLVSYQPKLILLLCYCAGM